MVCKNMDKMFKEPQVDFMTYNANDVLVYLKSIDKFDSNMPKIKYKIYNN